MTSKNKKQKDLELSGNYNGTSLTKKQKKIAQKALKQAKEVEKSIKDSGAKWVKTFKGYKLVKV